MIYTISDLHGYPVEKMKQLLKLAGFSGDDYLFILGDVIDRNGDGGIGILQWLLTVTNATLLLGHHEAMLLTCEFVIDEISEETLSNFTREKLEMLSNYIANGGDVTLRELRKLPRETQQDIFEYLKDCPLYETVKAGGKDYILVHAGLDTVKLNGEGFTVHVREGEEVKQGQLIMEADLDLINAKGYNPIIIVARIE